MVLVEAVAWLKAAIQQAIILLVSLQSRWLQSSSASSHQLVEPEHPDPHRRGAATQPDLTGRCQHQDPATRLGPGAQPSGPDMVNYWEWLSSSRDTAVQSLGRKACSEPRVRPQMPGRPDFTLEPDPMLDPSAYTGLPADVLQLVGQCLNSSDIQSARLVCQTWRRGVSLAVTHLRPVVGGSLGLQCPGMGLAITTAFPACHSLDFRNFQLLPKHVEGFEALPCTCRVQISNQLRHPEPLEALEEIAELASALQQANPGIAADLELRFSFADFQNRSLDALLQLPANVRLRMLHVSYPTSLSKDAIVRLSSLRSLEHLHLITHSAGISDAEFRALSALSMLKYLHLGSLEAVSSEGLCAGLQSLTSLRTLSLLKVSQLTDEGAAALCRSLPELQYVMLMSCPLLTNTGLGQLARLKQLRVLEVTDNSTITSQGLHELRHLKDLTSVGVRRCRNIDYAEVSRLLRNCLAIRHSRVVAQK